MVIITMANAEEKTIDVDSQGRMILPARVRERLGVKRGGRVSYEFENLTRLVIEAKASKNVEERVETWASLARSTQAQILGERSVPSSSKWMNQDYVRRKLGLQ